MKKFPYHNKSSIIGIGRLSTSQMEIRAKCLKQIDVVLADHSFERILEFTDLKGNTCSYVDYVDYLSSK